MTEQTIMVRVPRSMIESADFQGRVVSRINLSNGELTTDIVMNNRAYIFQRRPAITRAAIFSQVTQTGAVFQSTIDAFFVGLSPEPVIVRSVAERIPARHQTKLLPQDEDGDQFLLITEAHIQSIRSALCDDTPSVRVAAGVAFSELYKNVGMKAIYKVVPALFKAWEDEQTSDNALHALKQIVRSPDVLSYVLWKIVKVPLPALNARALGALADAAGPALHIHLGMILPALLSGMGNDAEDVRRSSKKAAETAVSVLDVAGIKSLLSELLIGITDSQASINKSSAYLIGYCFQNSNLNLAEESPNFIVMSLIMLRNSDFATAEVACESLSRVVSSVTKYTSPSYMKLVKDAISTFRDTKCRNKIGAILTALEGVITNTWKSVSTVVITRVHHHVQPMISSEDYQIRRCAASLFGFLLQYLEIAQRFEVLALVVNLATSRIWTERHGSALAISYMLRRNPDIVCASLLFTEIVNCLKQLFKDEKV
ncbi:hypothetical protein ACP275_06G165500 [Erythranthe tilingii]